MVTKWEGGWGRGKLEIISTYKLPYIKQQIKTTTYRDFPGGPMVKNPPSNAGDAGSIPGRGTKTPTCRGATKPARCTY